MVGVGCNQTILPHAAAGLAVHVRVHVHVEGRGRGDGGEVPPWLQQSGGGGLQLDARVASGGEKELVVGAVVLNSPHPVLLAKIHTPPL